MSEHLPLSYAQQRLWFLNQLEGSSSTEYNLPEVLRLRGELDRGAIERTINMIVERHESLRTHFGEVGGEAVQVIEPELRIAVPVEDLSGLGESEQRERVQAAMRQEANAPFDLARGPVLRMKLLKLGDEDHILLRTMHHIVSDGWSQGVFNREFEVLYEAYREGRENPLPALAVQYADFAIWQRKWLEGGALEEGLRYWKEQLKGISGELELPRDRPRPPVQTFVGEACAVTLPKSQLAALKRLSQENQATLYMTLLAGFAVLLWRYSGQEDIVVGSPIANRQEAQLEEMIGFFVNTLVMRVGMKKEMSFRELLKEVRKTALEGYRYQDVPFERLVEELSPQRSLNTTPIFQVVFALQNAPWVPQQMKALEVERIARVEWRVRFDLEVYALEHGGGLTFHWVYNRDLFDGWRIEQMARHCVRLLEQVLENADEAIGDIDLLGVQERRQVVYEWNDTTEEIPQDKCVHELFEKQVKKTPHGVAVVFEQQELTYAELNRRANRLAHFLRDLGVRPDGRVAICTERGFEMIIGLLAVLKAGGAYVPLDPSHPIERLLFMLQDSAPVALLTQGRPIHLLTQIGNQLPVIDLTCENVPWEEVAESDPDLYSVDLTPRHLAYVLYTSGSTGQPKGVMVEHASLVNFLMSMQGKPGICSDDVLLAITTIGFDIAALEIYLPLITGARLIMLSADASTDGNRLLAELKRGVTIMQATPASWRLLLEAGWVSTPELKALCGGETLNMSLAESLIERTSSVWNMYGPTETTVWSLINKLGCRGDKVSIGRPIANTKVYILDSQEQPVPKGVTGELYVSGAGVARGYLNHPELTAERFVKNPFSPGERMYRTGDLGRWSTDGNIEFVGRNDSQVKIRGFRIELGEIEASLMKYPAIRETAVIVREDTQGEKTIVAYYATSGSKSSVTAEQLRSYLSTTLPHYMIPTAFVEVGALPLTPNSKIDRRALPPPGVNAYVSRTHDAPNGEIEEKIAHIWSKVLKVEDIGREDNFFSLGGHSLLVLRVIMRMREILGLEISVGQFFETPTIAGLAQHVSGLQMATLPPGPSTPIDQDIEIPALTPQQELMWYQEQRTGSILPNTIQQALRISGLLNITAVEQSLQQLQRRHEALRTTFQPLNNGGAIPVASSADSSQFRIARLDLSALEAHEQEKSLLQAIHLDSSQPFDLTVGPLFRVTTIKLQSKDHVVLFTVHHLICDEWSVGVLISEFAHFYTSLGNNLPMTLPQLPFQYTDFACWQRRWLTSGGFAKPLAYWIKQLRPPLADLFPALASRYQNDELPFGIRLKRKFVIPRGITLIARTLSQSNECTLFSTVLSALKLVLFARTREPDLRVGTVIANRGIPGYENVVGLIANTVCLRSKMQMASTFSKFASSLQKVIRDATENEQLPFDVVTHALDVAFGIKRSAIFQVMVLWHANRSEPIMLPEARGDTKLRLSNDLGREDTVLARGTLEMLFELEETSAEIKGRVTYREDRFQPPEVSEILADLNRCLELAHQIPEANIGEICAILLNSRELLQNDTAYRKEA